MQRCERSNLWNNMVHVYKSNYQETSEAIASYGTIYNIMLSSRDQNFE